MKRRIISLVTLILLVQSLMGPPTAPVAQGPEPDEPPAAEQGSGMPGYPVPAKPIPHHEPGQPSRAGSYTTQVVQENELGALETVELSGLDAMAADGYDPLAENYTLVNWDSILASSSQDDQFNLQTFKYDPDAEPPAIHTIPGSENNVGAYPNNGIAAVDLNNDGQTEQIAAWIGEHDRIFMRIGEMPGSLGRTSSRPAAVVHVDGSIDLLVRGYDDALWHRHYDGSIWGEWDNSAGGILLSAPAVASQGDGQFDVFVIGPDNQVYRRRWDGGTWSSRWQQVGDWPSPAPAWVGPTPELPAPAAVARGGGFDLFRLGPDNTLQWAYPLWTPIAGELKQISVGSKDHVWGVNSNHDIFRWTGSGWEQIDGKLEHVSVGSDGTVWGVNSAGNVFRRDGDSWTPIAGELKQISVGSRDLVWGVNSHHDIFRWTGSGWEQIDGKLEHVSVGSDGTVWGVDSEGKILRRDWPWENLGGLITSAPSAVSKGVNHLQVFARGVDESLWHRTYNGGWGPWQRDELDGLDESVTIASAPSVLVSGSLADVYVQGSDDQLWQTQCDSSGCESWSLLGSPDGLASGVAVAAENWKYIVQIKTGGLVYSSDGDTWEDFGGLPPWHLLYDTGLTGHQKMMGDWQDFSLEVAPGYFWGDGRSQVALAYFSDSNKVSIAVYENGERFMPRLATQLALDQDIDYFSMATGDFLDGDGIDEIALAYTHQNTYNLDIIKVTRESLSVEATGQVETVKIPDEDGDDYRAGTFTGTFDITSGDFDGDGQDEIGLITVWHGHDWMWLPDCDSYLHSMRMGIYDVLKNLGTGEYRLKTYYVGKDKWDEKGAWWGEAIWDDPDPDRPAEIVGLAITAGDVDGDGKEELVRTWPVRFNTYADVCADRDLPVTRRFVRKLEVLKLPDNPDKYTNTWDRNNDGIISDPGITQVDFIQQDGTKSYQDRLVVGDLNRDLKYEIIYLMDDPLLRPQGHTLRTYYHDPYADEDPPESYKSFTDGKSLPRMKYPELAAGNFTWEGIRVGPPSYRVQNRVDTLVAHLNMPPKHRDLIKDAEGDYQLVESPAGECSPSPDSPNCTHAKYAALDFTSSEQTVTTQHAYEISGGVEKTACAGVGVKGIAQVKACTKHSIDYTHGGDFEKSTQEIESIGFRRKVIAANDDKVVYFGTPYGVWEYPILSGAAGEPSEDASEGAFITVAFPLISVTQYPDTSGGYYSGTCDETWYSAGHQPNNVWSYDPIGDVTFEDYDELAYDAIEGDWAEGEITYEELQSAFGSVSFSHSVSAGVETEVSGEAKIKVVDVSGSFKAYVRGQYSYAGMETDRLETSQETAFSYFLAPQPDSTKFTTRVLFYRAVDNYQVLNYQTEPGRAVSWQLYDKPDPAFILPWYGFPDPDDPQVPPCGEEQKLFSPDIDISPSHADLGESVTISATVRNFSNEPARNVFVRFYQGDPAKKVQIGEGEIPFLSRESGPETVSILWSATGVGEQKIYAVIDPFDALPEMHDADDLIDNNTAYGLLRLAATALADMALVPEQPPYDLISYALGDSAPTVSLSVPRASLDAVAHFEVGGAEIDLPVEGRVFQVMAYQGSKYKLWSDPIPDFDLKPEADDPPAVISIAYTQADLRAGAEKDLRLYRLEGTRWAEATCPGYETYRFPEQDLIAVPICQTGIFSFSDVAPGPIAGPSTLYLPLMLKTHYLYPWASHSAENADAR